MYFFFNATIFKRAIKINPISGQLLANIIKIKILYILNNIL